MKFRGDRVRYLSFPATASAMVLLLLAAVSEHDGYAPYPLFVSATALLAIWAQFFAAGQSKRDD